MEWPRGVEEAHVFRAAAAVGDKAPIDYTVLSVAVITLGLILIVELIRHRLDVAATGRPFFKAVLEGVYRELATLGIVEFFIFLLHKYYKNLNVAQELLFADVHFTLFFSALFNALQSALLAFCAFRVSERMWVRTEQLEVDHYVEIREEFDRVEAILQEKEEAPREDQSGGSDSTSVELLWDDKAESAFEFNCTGVTQGLKKTMRFIQHPHLYRKHQKLLVQIRFHELRYLFLKQNDLPLSVKVSSYLWQCELHILMKMVHISTFAWLTLTGGVIVVYYLMGIVVWTTEDLALVGKCLTGIFLSANILFVIMSLVIFRKMKVVYSTMMHQRVQADDPSCRRNDGNEAITSQRALFWMGNPKFIPAVIQAMQFGFAVALSILLVFWKDINVYYAPVPGWAVILAVLICYAAFVVINAQVLPRYTLCTSLGQMVNQRRLEEILAQSRLEREKREQLQKKLEQYEESFVFDDDASTIGDDVSRSSKSSRSSIVSGPIGAARKVLSSSLHLIGDSFKGSKFKTMEDIDFANASPPANIVATGTVPTDTESSQSSLMGSGENSQTSREQQIRDRKTRRKAQSEGVPLMRIGGQWNVATKTEPTAQRRPRNRERKRSLSSDDKIKEMRRSPSLETMFISELVQTDTKDLRDEQKKLQARRTRNRTRSVSDGVALMSMVKAQEEKTEEGFEMVRVSESKTPALAFSRPERPKRHRSQSASASIQQMRDSTLSSGDGLPVVLHASDERRRRPRSRQSSTGAPRLEPLVEGVPTEHVHSSQHLLPSDQIDGTDANTTPSTVLEKSSHSDDKSAKEALSLGDGHSEPDDIPDADPKVRDHHLAEPEPVASFSQTARVYFLSRKYKMISAVFGTMAAFYYVGMRIEALNIKTCAMPNYGNTWHVDLATGFWMETAWLSCFIATAFVIIFLFRPGRVFSNKERVILLSGIIDLCLSGTCFILLMVAQSRRCCDKDTENRLLADEATCYDGDGGCCPSEFGKRYYGGVGTIEPVTAIIALRVFRFKVAKKIIAFLDRKLELSDLDIASQAPEHVTHRYHPLFNMFGVRSGPKPAETWQERTGTMIELWTEAQRVHPEIVEQYGPFSQQLLQTMLGIEVTPDLEPAVPREIDTAPIDRSEPQPQEPSPTRTRRGSLTVDKKYKDLTPEAQSIILSGKVGKSVRMSTLSEHSEASDIHSGSPISGGMNLVRPALGENETPHETVKFELETVVSKVGGVQSPFVAPNARLVRSMRRCHRKLLPLLDNWSAVDVVITQFEIVYFDACDNFVAGAEGYTEDDINNIHSVRQAIMATKGGKTLRLCDVAKGRKVAGHLTLSDVDAINVERTLPSHETSRGTHVSPTEEKDVQVEFWKATSDHKEETQQQSTRDARWEHVKQDCLRIDSAQGTLLFRYFSDLEDSECHQERCSSERESEGPLFKNNAFQWCQTIVRFCGINQLKQKLPHFGNDDADELRDYLVIVDSKTGGDSRHVRKTSIGQNLGGMLSSVRPKHRRHSTQDLALLSVIEESNSSPLPLAKADRPVSFGESELSSRRSRKSSRSLHRFNTMPPDERNLGSSVNSQPESDKPRKLDDFHASKAAASGPDLV